MRTRRVHHPMMTIKKTISDCYGCVGTGCEAFDVVDEVSKEILVEE